LFFLNLGVFWGMLESIMARHPRRKAVNRNHVEHKMARNLDELARFEEFQTDVLPALRADLQAGLSAEDIYKKYTALAAARNITIALTDTDSGRALTAIRDILDRSGGKPTERKEVKHRMEAATDAELNSYVISQLKTLEESDEEDSEESDRAAH
jgi:hypothetical protein